jgi:hypothetical protein
MEESGVAKLWYRLLSYQRFRGNLGGSASVDTRDRCGSLPTRGARKPFVGAAAMQRARETSRGKGEIFMWKATEK